MCSHWGQRASGQTQSGGEGEEGRMGWRKEQTPKGGRARQHLKGGEKARPRLSNSLQQRGGYRAMGIKWKNEQHADERPLLYDQSSFACGRPTARDALNATAAAPSSHIHCGKFLAHPLRARPRPPPHSTEGGVRLTRAPALQVGDGRKVDAAKRRKTTYVRLQTLDTRSSGVMARNDGSA